MGGKSSGAPAPDPRLIEAQIKSLGIQDSAIQGILDLQKRMQPLQEEQMKFGLEAGRTAFEQSQADREYALGRRSALTGIQDTMITDAKSFNTQEKQDELAGQAIGDVRQAFSAARDSNARDVARMGINPNDGKFAAMKGQLSVAEALGTAQAGTGARTQARAEGRNLQDRAAGTLAGYPTMGMQTTGQGAQFAANGINLANSGVSGMSSGFGSAAQIAGSMGSNAGNMWGQQANHQANMQEQDQTGSILGGIGGLATGAAKLYALSDRRMKEGIEFVCKDERTGLNIYEFSYIDDPDMRRYHGVMSDEVRPKFPEAVTTGPDGFDRVNYQALGLEMLEIA